MEESAKLPLGRAICRYWPNVIAMALTPTVVAWAAESPTFGWSWPLLFIGLVVFGVFIPFRFGKAPYSFVVVSGLIYFVVGVAILMVVGSLLGLDGVPDQPSHSN